MSLSQYKALVVEENGNDYSSSIQSRSVDELPANDVLIQVHYSSLNSDLLT